METSQAVSHEGTGKKGCSSVAKHACGTQDPRHFQLKVLGWEVIGKACTMVRPSWTDGPDSVAGSFT